MNELGQALSKQRVTKKLSRVQLAEKAGVTSVYIARLENGNLIPSEDTLTSIADVLGLDQKTMLAMKGRSREALFNSPLAKWFREARAVAGKYQRVVAAEAGWHEKGYRELEEGIRRVPDKYIAGLACALGRDPAEISSRNPPKRPTGVPVGRPHIEGKRKPTQNPFGARFRELRDELGHTQFDIATFLDRRQTKISTWETSQYVDLELETLAELAEILQWNPSEMMTLYDQSKKPPPEIIETDLGVELGQLGRLVLAQLELHKLTEQELEVLVKAAPGEIRRLLRGKSNRLKEGTLWRLADRFNLQILSLIEMSDGKEKRDRIASISKEGLEIRRCRMLKGLTYKDVGDRACRSRQRLHQAETRPVFSGSDHLIASVTDQLGMDYYQLLEARGL